MTKSKISVLLGLLGLVFLTLGLILYSGSMRLPDSSSSGTYDSYMTKVQAVKFDSSGIPRYFLTSPKMTHFAHNNTTFIQQPFYVFKSTQEPPWHVNADQGIATQGTDVITLKGHVQIQQLSGRNSHEVTLLTDQIKLYPDRSFAETDRFVTLKRPESTVHAKGLQADLKKGYIRLLSQTRGKYTHVQQTQ